MTLDTTQISHTSLKALLVSTATENHTWRQPLHMHEDAMYLFIWQTSLFDCTAYKLHLLKV